MMRSEEAILGKGNRQASETKIGFIASLVLRYQRGKSFKNHIACLRGINPMEDSRHSLPVMLNHREGRLPVHAESLNESVLGVIGTPLQQGTARRARISGTLPVKSLPEGCSATGAGETLENPAPDLFLGEFEQDHKLERGSKGCQSIVQS